MICPYHQKLLENYDYENYLGSSHPRFDRAYGMPYIPINGPGYQPGYNPNYIPTDYDSSYGPINYAPYPFYYFNYSNYPTYSGCPYSSYCTNYPFYPYSNFAYPYNYSSFPAPYAPELLYVENDLKKNVKNNFKKNVIKQNHTRMPINHHNK
jgi:hypothetical protein